MPRPYLGICMKLEIILSALFALVVAVGGWWYLSSQTPPTVPPSTYPAQAPQSDGTDVTQNLVLGVTNDATLGDYLSAYNGMTLYTFAKDDPKASNCTGDCIANWPPYTVPSTDSINVPSLSSGVVGQIGTILRDDGRLQVTYNGAPLYFWKNDSRPGVASGQGVNGAWYVARP